jgi:DinB superfamily
MKRIRLVLFMTAVIPGTLLAVLIVPRVGFRHATETAAATGLQAQQSAPTLASVVDRDISAVEKQIVDVAEAMPEDKFNFSPETLNIPGGDYKGVRSFAVEVKHVAASNWFIWSPLTGEKLPEGLGDDGNGPANKKTKAEIIKFLKDSFALGHRAAATLTTENMLQAPGTSKSTRLRLAQFGVSHAYNHYGQSGRTGLVVNVLSCALLMNGS